MMFVFYSCENTAENAVDTNESLTEFEQMEVVLDTRDVTPASFLQEYDAFVENYPLFFLNIDQLSSLSRGYNRAEEFEDKLFYIEEMNRVAQKLGAEDFKTLIQAYVKLAVRLSYLNQNEEQALLTLQNEYTRYKRANENNSPAEQCLESYKEELLLIISRIDRLTANCIDNRSENFSLVGLGIGFSTGFAAHAQYGAPYGIIGIIGAGVLGGAAGLLMVQFIPNQILDNNCYNAALLVEESNLITIAREYESCVQNTMQHKIKRVK